MTGLSFPLYANPAARSATNCDESRADRIGFGRDYRWGRYGDLWR